MEKTILYSELEKLRENRLRELRKEAYKLVAQLSEYQIHKMIVKYCKGDYSG